MRPRITAVVVTWNSERLVPRLAATLRELRPLCISIVSDNASTDATVEMTGRELPEARVIRNPRNGGFGYGNNMALRECDTEYVLLLNSDASIGRDSLGRLLHTLDDNRSLGGVQPLVRMWGWPMITLSAGCSMNGYGRGYDMDFMHFQPRPDPEPREVPCITAALSLFRTDTLRSAGGFDERMFMYFEDVDLSLRLRSRGAGLLLQPGASGHHIMGASSGRHAAERWELRSSAYLTRKYLGGPRCRLPRYWLRREWRTRLHDLVKGIPWLWRLRASGQGAGTGVRQVELPGHLLSWILSPRPLRMPRPRSPDPSKARLSLNGGVLPGPGWAGNRTGTWGFGCLEVPQSRGRLCLELFSCDIPGSVALWSEKGFMARTLVGSGKSGILEGEVPGDVENVYLVPDRPEQTVELEKAHYEKS